MAFKENSRDYLYDDYEDDFDDDYEDEYVEIQNSLNSKRSHNYNFFLIYDPIIETEEEVLGGPWCFSISGKRAYLAFSSYALAEEFANLWNSSNTYDIVKINKIGTEANQELLDNVGHLLLLTSMDDIEDLITNVDGFPYEFYLIPRDKYLVH